MGPAFLCHAPLLLSLITGKAVAVQSASEMEQEVCAAPGIS